MKIRICNAAGINDPARFHRAISEAKQVDIMMYQETKLKPEKIIDVRLKHGFHQGCFMASHPQGSRRGVLTLFHPRLRVIHLENKADHLGQYLINVIVFNGHRMLIINVYGDPDTDVASLATLNRLHDDINHFLVQYDISSIVMGGDFNLVLYDTDTNTTSRKPNAARKLADMIDELDIHDIALLNSAAPSYTYFKRGDENIGARYDRIYCSPEVTPGAKIERLMRQDDHHPVQIVILDERLGPGLWMFDDRLLNSDLFKQKLQEKIKETIAKYCEQSISEVPIGQAQNHMQQNVNHFEVLSSIVKEVCTLAKQEMKERKKKEKERSKEALEALTTAREEFNNTNPPTDEARAQYEEAKLAYRSVQVSRADRAREVNHLRYTTLGEKMTSYHFAMMRRGRPSREIRQLNVGPRALNGGDIVHHMSDKYAELARRDPNAGTVSIEEYLGQHLAANAPKCPADLEGLLNAPIDVDDIKRVIKQMKNQSAPGPLGISNMLLKYMLPFIQNILVEAGNKWLFQDEMSPPPQWLAHRKVVFILKPNKDEKDEDSYRGLSMLENIFKAFSKIIADRMALALIVIQDSNQFGFTRGRGTLEASRTIIDIIMEANRLGEPLICISTDLYKAFDTVDRGHIINCLEFYQFPETFRRAYDRLTSSATVVFEVNRMISEQVEIQRGTGQGDPISSGTFNLAITPLDYYLATSTWVPRISLNRQEFPPVSYADDKVLVLKGDNLQSILDTVQKVADYEKVAGLRLNLSKCEVMTANCNPDTVQRLIQQTGMKLTNNMRHLGIHINSDGTISADRNLTPITQKMEDIASTYSTSMSTPIGRSIYAKYLLCSRYVHILQNVYITEEQAKELREAALQMTWTKPSGPGYRVHIAQDRVAQKIGYGGLSLPDPLHQKKSLAMAWLRKIKRGAQDMVWYQLLSAWLEEGNRPTPEEHLSLGHLEWSKTARALRNINKYWEDVFQNVADIIIAANKAYQQWHLLPILGSFPRCDEGTIAPLVYSNMEAREVGTRIKNIGMLFHTNDAGQIQPNRIKNRQELGEMIGQQIPILVMNSIAVSVQEVKRTYRQKIQTKPEAQTTDTPLLLLIEKYGKGCSAATDALLAADRKTWTWGDAPRAYSTYRQDGMIDITVKEYFGAFVRIRASLVSPRIQWTSWQVLLRTLWTNHKESMTARNGGDPTCNNCFEMNSVQNAKHLFHDCTVAHALMTVIVNAINDYGQLVNGGNPDSPYPVVLNPYLVLFHKLPRRMSESDKTDIADALMTAKHRLYRIRCRDDNEAVPTPPALLIIIVHDLEWHLRILNHKVKAAPLMRSLISKLKDIANLA